MSAHKRAHPAEYVQLVAGLMSNQPQLMFILPKIALFFDKVHVLGEVHRTDVLEQRPYATFSAEVSEKGKYARGRHY